MNNKFKTFNKIDTVHGVCEECEEDTILVAIVSDFYRCTNCGPRKHKKSLNKSEKRQKRTRRYKGQGKG